MTREIKFRGKGSYGIWKVGSYVRVVDINDNTIHSITSVEGFTNSVDSKTVGQYTGLKDKNGKEIYEGDIIQNKIGSLHEVFWSSKDSGFCFRKIHNPIIGFSVGVISEESMEISGNVYENPELLKNAKNTP